MLNIMSVIRAFMRDTNVDFMMDIILSPAVILGPDITFLPNTQTYFSI